MSSAPSREGVAIPLVLLLAASKTTCNVAPGNG
jgi:hypothetical protein